MEMLGCSSEWGHSVEGVGRGDAMNRMDTTGSSVELNKASEVGVEEVVVGGEPGGMPESVRSTPHSPSFIISSIISR